MTSNNEQNSTVRTDNTQPKNSLRVYRKDGKWGYWYSATRSDGNSVNVCFDKDLQVPDLKAFEILNVVGTLKQKTVVKDNETYENYTYYVSKCDFRKIEGDVLPL